MCEECNDKGWLVLDEDHMDKLVIQRCDSCEKFDTDNEAVLHVEQITTETLKLKEFILWVSNIGLAEMRQHRNRIDGMLADCAASVPSMVAPDPD